MPFAVQRPHRTLTLAAIALAPTESIRQKVGSSDKRSTLWSVISGLAAAGAAMAVRKILASRWPGSSQAPVNPADRGSTWTEALAWAIASGIGAGVARTVARRGAAEGWHAAFDESPPPA